MINTELTEKSESLLIAELDQAWSHYRHLEETRTKYLNFFFTMLLASVGFIITLSKDFNEVVSIKMYFGLSAFTFSFFLISVILLLGIVRIGYVLSSYEKVMEETRRYFHGESSPILELWNIRKGIPNLINRKMFSIQSSSVALVSLVCVILCILQYFLFEKIRLLETSPEWINMLAMAFMMIMVVIVIMIMVVIVLEPIFDYISNKKTKAPN